MASVGSASSVGGAEGPASRRLLIVNADDMGRTAGINAGILAAHRDGIVSSATLMVASPAAADAAAALADYPRLGVGLHVTLTGGTRPTLPAAAVPSLVDADGCLPRRPEGLASADPADVRAEIRSQLQRFRDLTGRLPTHFDSHHHVHALPHVLDAVIELARHHHLPVRNASSTAGRRLREVGVPTTDAFEERFFGAGAQLDTLLDILERLGEASTELMCHPGRVDEALRADSTYVSERGRELEVLTDPAARRALEAFHLELVHFGQLAGTAP